MITFDRLELAAGEDQLIVVFLSKDTQSMIDVGGLTNAVAEDAAQRRQAGWRLLSVASMPMRQMGTAGNVFFQSGGQYITRAALIATYSRD